MSQIGRIATAVMLGFGLFSGGCAAHPASNVTPEDNAAPTASGAKPSGGRVLPFITPMPGSGISDMDCILTSDEGEQYWVDEPSATIVRLADELQDLVNTHSSEATGTIYCSKYEGVVVTVATPTDELRWAIDELAEKYPEYAVYIAHVQGSMDTLLAATRDILDATEYSGLITGGGPDVATGGLVVYVDRDPADFNQIREAVRATLGELEYPDLPIQVEHAGHEVLDVLRRGSDTN